jgi:hypothetical protein
LVIARRWIESQGSAARLPRVPDRDDLLRIGDRLALGLDALGRFRRPRGCALPALRLGRLFGNGTEIWLRMQQDYDLWHANSAMKAELEGIKPLDADAA